MARLVHLFRRFYKRKVVDRTICASPVLAASTAARTVDYMLRLLMLGLAAIVAVVVVIAILHVLWWLMTVALIIFAIGLLFGVFRLGRRSARRSAPRK